MLAINNTAIRGTYMNRIILVFLLALVVKPTEGFSQAKRGLNYGLSVGYRFAYDSQAFLQDASISPIDSTLQFDSVDRGGIIVSGTVAYYPFKVFNLGLALNLNIAEFGAAQSNFQTISTQRIEGGIGLIYGFSDNFGVSLTYENFFSRRLRSNIRDLEGQQIVVNGSVLTELNQSNNSLFIDNYLNGLSIKANFFFNRGDDSK